MNICKVFGLSCLIIASSHAVEIQNHSTLPALIDKITLSVNTGLDEQPSIQERKIKIAPNQTISHKELSGQAYAIVLQVALVFNNTIYLFAISPQQQSGFITIHTDGHISSSKDINLTERRSTVFPIRNKQFGPRLI